MKIAALADKPDPAIEGMLAEADVLVTLGDLYPQDVPDTHLDHFFVYGNHDSPHLPFSAREGRRDLHLAVAAVGGVTFGGFQGSRRYKPKGHYLYDDEEVAELLEGFPRVDVFVAHAPCTALEIADGVHDGLAAFDRYIERQGPRLFLCGHVHRPKEVMVGETRCVCVLGAALIEV